MKLSEKITILLGIALVALLGYFSLV